MGADQDDGDGAKARQTAEHADPRHVLGGEVVDDAAGEEQQRRQQAAPGADFDFDAGTLPVGRKAHAALGLPRHWFSLYAIRAVRFEVLSLGLLRSETTLPASPAAALRRGRALRRRAQP